MSLPGLVAGALDRLEDQVERGAVGLEVGREAALVAEAGGQALLLEHRLERVVDLGAPAQRLAEGGRADRGDHELLDVDIGVGVAPPLRMFIIGTGSTCALGPPT
jgi:hypothetical protein